MSWPTSLGDVFVFPFGAFVAWGVPDETLEHIMQELKKYEGGKIESRRTVDSLSVTYARN